MSSPSSSTSPASAADGTSSCMRLRMRRKVDLPQPDGPIRAVIPEAGIVSDTRSRTWWLPNHAVMSRASRVAGPAGAASCGRAGAGRVDCVMVVMPSSGVEAGGRQRAARLQIGWAGSALDGDGERELRGGERRVTGVLRDELVLALIVRLER